MGDTGVLGDSGRNDAILKGARHRTMIKTVNSSPSPRVVIVIPCYNQAHFLPQAVESVCAQTYEQLEIVIVDDGSPDDTAEVARQLAAEHPERAIRVVRQHNQGLPASRNRGIETSDAEFIVALDADDKLTPQFVELCVAALDQHPEVSIADGDHHTFGDDDRLITHASYDFVRLTHSNQIGVASMFRRRAWEDVGGYNEQMCSRNGVAYEDWDFWIGCGEHGHFGVHVPSALFYYRIREDSMFQHVDDQRTKARIILNHPVLYAPEQTAWARGIVDGDPATLVIDGPRYQIPVLGTPRVREVRSGGAITGARGFATLAMADELIEQPELVRTYCSTFSGPDDATLIVLGSQEQLAGLGGLLREFGHDGDDDADVLGLAVADPQAELPQAATMVDALLTRRVLRLPVPLPRVDGSGVEQLLGRCRAQSAGTGLGCGLPSRDLDSPPGAADDTGHEDPADRTRSTAQAQDAIERWAERLDEETAFWFRWLRDHGGEWPQDYAQRMDPDSELQPDIRAYLEFAPDAHLRILDVGCGPLTILGKRWGDRTLAITAADPLAEQYAMLFERLGLTPPVVPVAGVAERLTETFADNSFDLVYARNCLDHGYDPLLSIQQMLKVAKPGRVVFIEHAIDEGEHEDYGGLHQWNFRVKDDRFVIWRPGLSIDAHSVLEEQAHVEISPPSDGSRYVRVALHKRQS
jgi:SAM-dependent methyltransferase